VALLRAPEMGIMPGEGERWLDAGTQFGRQRASDGAELGARWTAIATGWRMSHWSGHGMMVRGGILGGGGTMSCAHGGKHGVTDEGG
jgi:hypothetical protein